MALMPLELSTILVIRLSSLVDVACVLAKTILLTVNQQILCIHR
jgi:hypothetical protein